MSGKKRRRLPPDPERQNNDRAAWAEVALRAFAEETGLKPEADEWETVVGDLLADIAHFCDRNDLDFLEIVNRSRRHYSAETSGRGAQLAGAL
jgi:8-oxo-dGTP pyrophosphatase MutT (NUDIX family)